MSTIEKAIVVNRPVKTVYNQWTQFEDFPRFMEGITQVQQLDDKHVRWSANIGGKTKQWIAEITQQVPDSIICWQNEEGAPNKGKVIFQDMGEAARVTVQIDYDPQGAAENTGDVLGVLDRQVSDNLERFKRFIEKRGQETGAWRENI